jgi:hypothetical protein
LKRLQTWQATNHDAAKKYHELLQVSRKAQKKNGDAKEAVKD